MSVGRSSEEAITGPDPSWRGLYRAGAISAVLYVVLNIGALVLLLITPPAPSSGGAATLQYIASHKSVYLLELVLFVALSVFTMVVGLALNSSPPSLNGCLIYLSDQYVAATTAAQRVAFATAAEGHIAVTNAVNSAGILFEVGILIISLVMLKGVFHKGVAYLGIVTG